MFMGVDCGTLLDVVPFVEVVQDPLAIRTLPPAAGLAVSVNVTFAACT
jgi:hypothetical protein